MENLDSSLSRHTLRRLWTVSGGAWIFVRALSVSKRVSECISK